MVDWGAGRYETTAAELHSVAEDVIARAEITPGERVLDIACGTGNAALLAARAGAAATGVDSAPRLLGVARERAEAEGLDVSFVAGDVQQLPFSDAGFDVVVSVFGIIFAADAALAFREAVRVMRPGGRALITAWTPDGAIAEMSRTFATGLAAAASAPPGKRFAWHDADAIAGLAAANSVGADVVAEGGITFTAASADDYLQRYELDHPASRAQRPILEQAGTYAGVRAQALAALIAGNESADAFAVTSRYRVIAASR